MRILKWNVKRTITFVMLIGIMHVEQAQNGHLGTINDGRSILNGNSGSAEPSLDKEHISAKSHPAQVSTLHGIIPSLDAVENTCLLTAGLVSDNALFISEKGMLQSQPLSTQKLDHYRETSLFASSSDSSRCRPLKESTRHAVLSAQEQTVMAKPTRENTSSPEHTIASTVIKSLESEKLTHSQSDIRLEKGAINYSKESDECIALGISQFKSNLGARQLRAEGHESNMFVPSFESDHGAHETQIIERSGPYCNTQSNSQNSIHQKALMRDKGDACLTHPGKTNLSFAASTTYTTLPATGHGPVPHLSQHGMNIRCSMADSDSAYKDTWSQFNPIKEMPSVTHTPLTRVHNAPARPRSNT
ncbi:hypothetical protein BASA62_005647 [Batrachochytrium salamandrivorans]|nr:hypothetical protein BASA62_005647 [Batrachochytrium salamandrivorans]